ncbi:MAG: rhodanese-like domain-containing protein [Oceanisphaera sp.]|uniref:rhodanese-like domain-containing protein n=1 Tax=Oceanisphaera sp. TaxID=1929979 RepID=UPI003C753136
MKYWTVALLLSSPSLALANAEVWIDVGSQEEYATEHLHDAVHIPYTYIARGVSARYPDKQTAIKLYDRDGFRAQQASEALQTLGYQQVMDKGGLAALKESGLTTQQTDLHADATPTVAVHSLNDTAGLYADLPAIDSY